MVDESLSSSLDVLGDLTIEFPISFCGNILLALLLLLFIRFWLTMTDDLMISNGSEKSFLEVDDALPGVADFSSLNDIRLIMFELSVTAFAIVVAIESSWSGRFVATSSLTEDLFSNETDLSFSDFLVPNNDESVAVIC